MGAVGRVRGRKNPPPRMGESFVPNDFGSWFIINARMPLPRSERQVQECCKIIPIVTTKELRFEQLLRGAITPGRGSVSRRALIRVAGVPSVPGSVFARLPLRLTEPRSVPVVAVSRCG